MGEGGEWIARARFIVWILAAHGEGVAARFLARCGMGGLEERVAEYVLG